MTSEEWTVYLDGLATLCERALDGTPSLKAARTTLLEALADPACPLNLVVGNGVAEAARVEVGRRAEMVRALDPSLFGYRAALNGLKLYFVWAQENVPAPGLAVRSPFAS